MLSAPMVDTAQTRDPHVQRPAVRIRERPSAGVTRARPPSAAPGPAAAGPAVLQRCGGRACDCGPNSDHHGGLLAQARPSGVVVPSAPVVPSLVSDVLRRGAGQPLDGQIAGEMRGAFGRGFGEVRVHTDGLAARSVDAVGADAFTVGHDIVFAAGKYRPGSPEGVGLLAHELTHVVQQAGATRPDGGIVLGAPGDAAEREAASMSASVLAGRHADIRTRAGPGSVQCQVDEIRTMGEKTELAEAAPAAGAVTAAGAVRRLMYQPMGRGIGEHQRPAAPMRHDASPYGATQRLSRTPGNAAVTALVLQKQRTGSEPTSALAAAAAPSWNFDPMHLLDAPEVNPEFRKVAKRALAEAVSQGLRPRVEYAYRSAQLQQDIKQRAPKGRAVATPFGSWHQYGLAMDVKLYDASHHDIEDPPQPGWLQQFTGRLVPICQSFGLEWGVPNDSGHFEYHPNWPGSWMPGATAKAARTRALTAAAETGNQVNWMQFFWHEVGADGVDPLTLTIPMSGDELLPGASDR